MLRVVFCPTSRLSYCPKRQRLHQLEDPKALPRQNHLVLKNIKQREKATIFHEFKRWSQLYFSTPFMCSTKKQFLKFPFLKCFHISLTLIKKKQRKKNIDQMPLSCNIMSNQNKKLLVLQHSNLCNSKQQMINQTYISNSFM